MVDRNKYMENKGLRNSYEQEEGVERRRRGRRERPGCEIFFIPRLVSRIACGSEAYLSANPSQKRALPLGI